MQRSDPDLLLVDDISNAILRLQEDGYLQQLDTRWFGRSACPSATSKDDDRLGVGSLSSIFIFIGVVFLLAATLHVLDKYFPPFRRALAYLRVHPRPRGRGRVTKLLDKAGHLNEDVFESSSELGSSVVEHVRGPRGAHRPPSVDGDGSQNHAGGEDGVQLITSPGESFDIGGGSCSSGFGRTQLSPAFAAGEGMVSTPGSRRRNLMSRFRLRRGRSTASTGTSVKAGSAAAGPSRGSSATGRSPMVSMPPLPVSENVFLAPVPVEEQPSLAASTFGSVVELARLRAAAAAMDDEAEGPAPATAATGGAWHRCHRRRLWAGRAVRARGGGGGGCTGGTTDRGAGSRGRVGVGSSRHSRGPRHCPRQSSRCAGRSYHWRAHPTWRG